jgi:nucleotide-binding universal stress UspA family protein
MFRRILVPVDFTPRSRRAARVAARMAASAKAETTLLHVIERIEADAPGSLAGFYRKLERNARAKLAELVEDFTTRGLPACGEVLYGSRVNEILRFSQENAIDLIVMSSHKLPLRRGGENWGTISYKVGILSRCPVLLVK